MIGRRNHRGIVAALAVLDGAGHLVITAERARPAERLRCWYGACTHLFARLTTMHRVTLKAGKVEARMKVPRGKGLWSAFWLKGDDFDTVGHPKSGEIDVAEVLGHEPNVSWASLHGPGYVRAGLTRDFKAPDNAALSDDFHTYAVDGKTTASPSRSTATSTKPYAGPTSAPTRPGSSTNRSSCCSTWPSAGTGRATRTTRSSRPLSSSIPS